MIRSMKENSWESGLGKMNIVACQTTRASSQALTQGLRKDDLMRVSNESEMAFKDCVVRRRLHANAATVPTPVIRPNF